MIWGSVILMGIGLLALLWALATGDFSYIHFNIKGIEPKQVGFVEIIATIFIVAGYVLFFMALFKLKQLVSHFIKKELFTEKTVHLSKKIGSFFVLTPIFLYAPSYIYEIITATSVDISLSIVSPESFFFLIVMGLFFLTLGYIFQEAKNVKEENELTV